ncbi:putative thioesterase atnL [Colletotrichum shisoi]|uniref:Putative thioesterase atnL n=1 Tax=Colletotrichum shisoi TaxID=2078593 RepID=A0A5Q4C4Y6_9PEZI|nr:putative thioesterase atnL [Colletotrichum shisoi]
MSDTLMFDCVNETGGHHTESPKLATNHEAAHGLSFLPQIPSLSSTGFASQLTPSTIFVLILMAFCALNLKSFPFVWHLRVLNAFRFTIKTLRPRVRPRPSMVFQPIITSSSADLAEMDFNLHKTNSSYFADADIARAHLMSTLFAPAIERMRGGSGAVSCSFRREIHPGSAFDMWTLILAWDDKWFYIATHFVRRGAGNPGTSSLYPDQAPRGGHHHHHYHHHHHHIHQSTSFKADKDLYATALSRCVFKSGRKTASPADMLRMAGLVPDDGEVSSSDESDDETTDSELLEVEEQSQGGMKLAAMLTKENQLALEAEFHDGEGEVLGRHTDGTGVAGVVLTLLQLAGLKKKWYL